MAISSTVDPTTGNYTPGKNKWGWHELENTRVNVAILDIQRAYNFVFRFFYDPNVEVNGDTATWFAKQSNRRVKYFDDISYRSFKSSPSLRQNLELVEFGCYGDVYSRDFGKLAISNSQQLEEFIDLHQKNAMNELNNDILRKFKEDINNDANFRKPHAIIENDITVYEEGTTNGKDNAEILWSSIFTQAMRMCHRSDKYNVGTWDKKEMKMVPAFSNIASIKEIVIIYTPEIHSMIKGKLYANASNVDEIRLEPLFHGVGIMDFSDHAFSTDTFDSSGVNTGYGKWYDSRDKIVMLGKDSYKICDAVNPPLFIDNTHLGLSLKTYFFKWFFGFCGFIKFINACKWKSK